MKMYNFYFIIKNEMQLMSFNYFKTRTIVMQKFLARKFVIAIKE